MATLTPPKVKLRQGTYVGKTRPANTQYPKALHEFLGVPYAQSTAGPNRFRHPRPLSAAAPGAGETAAVEFGEQCPGVLPPPRGVRAGENCLNANVYVPANPSGHRLPVVLYVHGGAFNMGLGAERNMASFVSWAAEDLVGISFNYRVGPLGFLPAAVAADQSLENLGLRDQQAMFRWVQDNVDAFGGDRDNVTVMGLSAGAHSIGHHLIYYATTAASEPTPFRRAILESGSPTARSVLMPTHPRHVAQWRQFLASAGVQDVPECDVLAALRRLPLEAIHSAALAVWATYSASVCWPFQPTIDGVTIPDLPVANLRRQAFVRVPILTGFNDHEGAGFVPKHLRTDAEFRAFFRTLIPTATDAEDLDPLALQAYPDPTTNTTTNTTSAAAAAHLYRAARAPPPAYGPQWARAEAAYAHYAYICPVLQLADAAARAGCRVHVYRFAAATSPHLGTANHADNAPFAAHDLAALSSAAAAGVASPPPGLMAIAAAMHGAYVRFASGASLAASWPPFAPPPLRAARLLVFGRGSDERMGPAGSGRRGTPVAVETLSPREVALCRFWWDRVDLSQGSGRARAAVPRRPPKSKL